MNDKSASLASQYGMNVANTRVKYKDFFHLKMLYKYMHEWLVKEGWGTFVHQDFPEEMFMTNQRADGEEVYIWWRMTKKYDGKVSSYVKKVMDVDIHVQYMKNVEKIVNGQKIQGHKGQVEVLLFSRLLWDPSGEWRKHWFLKHFNDYYIKRFNKRFQDQNKLELYRETYKFYYGIKNHLKLYTTMSPRRTFDPQLGMPQSVEQQ